MDDAGLVGVMDGLGDVGHQGGGPASVVGREGREGAVVAAGPSEAGAGSVVSPPRTRPASSCSSSADASSIRLSKDDDGVGETIPVRSDEALRIRARSDGPWMRGIEK